MMIIFRLLSWLPWRVLYSISDFLYFLAYYIVGYRKKVVARNLAQAFPEKTPEERKKIEKQFYKNLADVVVEIIKALNISVEEFHRRVQIEAPETLLQYLKNGSSVFALTAHQGNWEWLLLYWSIHLQPYATVDAVYKPLRNQFFDKLMLRIRQRFGAEAVPMQNILRKILSHKNDSRVIAMVADQRPAGDEKNYWTTFLHQDTPFFIGPEKLALKTKLPLVFAGMYRLKRGHYVITMKNVTYPPYTEENSNITEIYASLVEKEIQEHPADWLWSHERWKHKRQST